MTMPLHRLDQRWDESPSIACRSLIRVPPTARSAPRARQLRRYASTALAPTAWSMAQCGTRMACLRWWQPVVAANSSMIVFLSARQLALYRSLTAASNSSLVAMLTRLIPSSARLPLWEQLRRGNDHDSGAVLARQCAEIGPRNARYASLFGLGRNRKNLIPRVAPWFVNLDSVPCSRSGGHWNCDRSRYNKYGARWQPGPVKIADRCAIRMRRNWLFPGVSTRSEAQTKR